MKMNIRILHLVCFGLLLIFFVNVSKLYAQNCQSCDNTIFMDPSTPYTYTLIVSSGKTCLRGTGSITGRVQTSGTGEICIGANVNFQPSTLGNL